MTRLECVDPEKIIPISRLSTEVFKTGAWGARIPLHEERLSPCREACPAGEDISVYMALAREGDLEGAFMRLTQENPLPAVCGRVCYHPCEAACLRGSLGDGAVSIHRAERHVGDYGLEKLSLPGPAMSDSGASVAVVGSGPAGLSCAYHARRLGHKVTVFEAEKVLGGLLRLGIPAYRLPRDVLEKSIKSILDTGIEVKTGFRLGAKGTWSELNAFDAVFLALGAHEPIMPKIEGLDRPGVMSGIAFLKKVNLGRLKEIEGPVAVMGGGNAAIDAARVSLRLGAKTTVFYRRSRQEMPASAEEISDALKEGVALRDCSLPVAVAPSKGGLRITCLRTGAQSRDESGRMRYALIKNSEFEAEVKTLILGLGQAVAAPEERGPVAIASDGLQVGPYLETLREKFYAGGDMVAVPRRVCDAIGSGKLAALAMHAKLKGLDMESLWRRVRIGEGTAFSMYEYLLGGESQETRIKVSVKPEEVKPEWFDPSEKIEPIKLSAEEAVKGFEEVVRDVGEEEFAGASGRCFSCGTCTSCDRCYIYCPEGSITPPGEGAEHYEGDIEYCKGCGVCAAVCPRGVMTMREGK